jgi:hypothetical protein
VYKRQADDRSYVLPSLRDLKQCNFKARKRVNLLHGIHSLANLFHEATYVVVYTVVTRSVSEGPIAR